MEKQYISLNEDTPQLSKKAERIELRAFKEIYPLSRNQNDLKKVPQQPQKIESKKRVSVFCLGQEISLKKLASFTKTDNLFSKSVLYYGECLYSKIKFNHFSDDESLFSDIIFLEYGCLITWGLTEKQENLLINKISPFVINEYKVKEFEYLHYTIMENEVSYFSDDIFYLKGEDFFTKMVISNSLAQSVKLDYFESNIDMLIQQVRNLPSDLKSKSKLVKPIDLIGKLFEIKFDINLISNILDEPEILWYYPEYSNLYEAMKHCFEINVRTDLLNKRCETIEDLLKFLLNREMKEVDISFTSMFMTITGAVFVAGTGLLVVNSLFKKIFF